MKKLLALLLCAAMMLSLVGCAAGETAPTNAGAETIGTEETIPVDSRVAVTYVMANDISPVEMVLPGTKITLPNEVNYGFVLVNWLDENGNIQESDTVVIEKERTFSAVTHYALTDQHVAYIEADENYSFHLDDEMTNEDAAEMLCRLLVIPADVKDTATSALREIGVHVEGEPEDLITVDGFAEMLVYFKPAFDGSALHDLQTDEDKFTRMDAIRMLNEFLGRVPDYESIAGESRCWWNGMPEDEDAYMQVMEAAVTHFAAFAGEEEVWHSAEWPQPIFESGFTTGSLATDSFLAGVVSDVTSDEASLEDNLRELYRFVRKNYAYRKMSQHSVDDMSEWLNPTIISMVETGKGNCYSFAGLLYALFRAYGFDCEMCVGTFCKSPHGWVAATIDGVEYIFDVETEWASLNPRWTNPGHYVNMFMLDPAAAARWNYVRELPESAEGAEI